MIPSTYDKALDLNLDPQVYGAFAEIGAGQETANWFFRASGTAGMMAKSISAYDMTMSDAIYGRASRYVSCERLEAMLDHEYGILLERLAPVRGRETTFFAFCNTVKAKGWKDAGEYHGWLGLRFQRKPGAPPSEITLHVRLLDDDGNGQADALGIVGVNLLYGAYRHLGDLKRFVESLVENLAPGRVEVDLLKLSGEGFEGFDNRLCALQLVESGLTDATMFLPSGEVVQPAEALYRRPVLLLRGSFNPVTKLHLEMVEGAAKVFSTLLEEADRGKAVALCEISLHNLLRDQGLEARDFLGRADALQALGATVLLSNCSEFYRIAGVLGRCTDKPKGIILSIGLLNELFKPKWSAGLAGGVLESFGRLFLCGTTLLVFPWRNRRTGELVGVENFKAPADSELLYQYFTGNRRILGIPCDDMEMLNYTGRDVLRMIGAGDDSWRKLVPEAAWSAVERQTAAQPS